ncbi:hypothetical protein V6N13_004846 [Hibiscus sabdariffa]|uniref:Coenzyme Q-binding protein COQ10 START domain-containing protein n=1 Tax=Hibiscus sabdariffa TaxID=183260 RepID=A0ABR2RZP2_9ROSI
MSSAAISFISSPNSLSLTHVFPIKTNPTLSCRVPPLKPPSFTSFFIRIPYGSSKKSPLFNSSKPFSPVMKWQDCTVKMEIDVPAAVAYDLYSDREAIPNWMPFVSSVKVLEDKPDLSRWFVKYEAFGRNIEYSWLAKNLQPIPNQKIHWRSLEGLGNRGSVRFYPKGPSSCLVDLSISYEVPQLLVPVASLLQPFMESLLKRGRWLLPVVRCGEAYNDHSEIIKHVATQGLCDKVFGTLFRVIMPLQPFAD